MPLIIVDDILFPTLETEVGLDEAEVRHLEGAGRDHADLGPVILASRLPGVAKPTRLEERGADEPERLVAAAVLGMAYIKPPQPDDLGAQLVVEENVRVRLAGAEQGEHGWMAAYESWSLDLTGVESQVVGEAQTRFYRVLVGTRDPETEGQREQLEKPIAELEATEGLRHRLWLMADYLFDDPHVRARLVTSETGSDLLVHVTTVLNELDSVVGTGAIRKAVSAYLRDASEGPVQELADIAKVLGVLLPLLDDGDDYGSRLREISGSLLKARRELEALTIHLAEKKR